jgi:DNA helicase HerA-like ATPase
MVIAEGLSRIGVPVFIADVKGDVSGLATPGAGDASPVIFWDLEGAAGHPVRATVSEIGPSLLARMLELNDVQGGVLDIAFKLADEQGLLLLDLDDLRSLLNLVSDKHAEVSQRYGLVSAQSVAAIQRALLGSKVKAANSFLVSPRSNSQISCAPT